MSYAADADLVLLRVDLDHHPCVFLHEEAIPFDALYSYGYPDDHPDGDPATFELEGIAGKHGEQLKFKTGQVRPGLSGAPLLNTRTGYVCGIVQLTRDRNNDLGGRAIPTSTVLRAFPDLADKQRTFHERDRQWTLYLRTVSPSPKEPVARPGNYIPVPRQPLFQPRQGEFERLEALLFGQATEQQPVRLALVGMGGVGKTQLAVELAYRYQERFPAGIFWMSATGTTVFDWQRQFAELASNTDYRPPDDDISNPENESRRARHFCRYLTNHSDALMILDNVEDPNLAMTALSALAGGNIACPILYTSRVTTPLPGITTYPVELLTEERALRLLLETTRPALLSEVMADSQGTEAKAARSICQDVGYLPLALIHLRGPLARDQRLTLARLMEELKQRSVLENAKTQQGDAAPLFATFWLSWEKVQNEGIRRVFKLACYFPEATFIPLWLLGLAAGLGESEDIFGLLGEAVLQMREMSLLEAGEQVRMHPLLREFGRKLVADEGKGGTALLKEARERLVLEFTDLKKLEQRARQKGYWVCLEQVRLVCAYITFLGNGKIEQLERIERWLDRESYLLGIEQWWPQRIPELFYQQIYNRSVEAGHPLQIREAPGRWVRQEKQVGAEDQLLLRVFAVHTPFSPLGSTMTSVGGNVIYTGVWSVAFSPDGTQILTGSGNGAVHVWETRSGKQRATLDDPDSLEKIFSSYWVEWA